MDKNQNSKITFTELQPLMYSVDILEADQFEVLTLLMSYILCIHLHLCVLCCSFICMLIETVPDRSTSVSSVNLFQSLDSH